MTDRDEKGRWLKGGKSPNPGGRPHREQAERYYDILITTLTDERWLAIVLKACEQAERGDRYARKWLADYGLGPAEQRLLLAAAPGELTVTYVNDWRKHESADE